MREGGPISSEARPSDFCQPQPGDMKAYRHGALNDPKIIYPVGGGMEDWAYAASWSKSAVRVDRKTRRQLDRQTDS